MPFERIKEVLSEGVATPDHILNTKRTPVWVEPADPGDSSSVEQTGGEAYSRWVEEYTAYYDEYNSGEGMLPPVPRVVLVAGLGMFSTGNDRRAATKSRDIYRHTISIIEAAEKIGRYRSLSRKHAFEVEYWPLELYKLTLAPPDKELSSRVVLITGAAGERCHRCKYSPALRSPGRARGLCGHRFGACKHAGAGTRQGNPRQPRARREGWT